MMISSIVLPPPIIPTCIEGIVSTAVIEGTGPSVAGYWLPKKAAMSATSDSMVGAWTTEHARCQYALDRTRLAESLTMDSPEFSDRRIGNLIEVETMCF